MRKLMLAAGLVLLPSRLFAQPPPPPPPPGPATDTAPSPAPAPVQTDSPGAVEATPLAVPDEVAGDSAPAPHLQTAREPVPLVPGEAPQAGGGYNEVSRSMAVDGGGEPTAGGQGDEAPAGATAAAEVAPTRAHAPSEESITEAAEAAGTPEPGTAAATAEAAGPPFIKGELIYPGTRRLLSRFDHVGVGIGPEIIGNDFYLDIDPGMAWYFDNGISVSAHAPLRLIALEGGNFVFGGLKIRSQDWDEVGDYAKLIRFITYGRKESNLYLSINTMRPATIGHGLLINRYQGDIDVDRSMTGVLVDGYNRYGGFELQANDVTFKNNRIIGGLLFFKPLSFFGHSPYAEGLSLGFEAAANLLARCVRMNAGSDECVQGSGHAAGFHPYTGASLDESFVRTNPDTGRFAVKTTEVWAIGASVEGKVYKDARNTDLKLYGNWHRYMNEGGGDVIAGGLLARLNAGTTWIHAFRLRGEYRTFSDGYLPSYFDTLYEIQKYGYVPRENAYQVTPTKFQAVFGDPENGFARENLGWRHGYNLEASWALFFKERSAKKLGFGLGLQDSTGPNDLHAYVHLETAALGWLQIFGTYLVANAADFGDLVRTNPASSQNAILLAGLRLQVFPFLFINAHYSRSFRVVASPGSEYHLGTSQIVDSRGQPSSYFETDRLFENVQTLFAQIELGWEFDDD